MPAFWGGLVACASIAAVIHSLWFVWHFQIPEIWGDCWVWIDEYRNSESGHLTFAKLIAPINDHRIATTRLLYLLDIAVDRMRGLIPSLATICCLVLEGVALAALGRVRARPLIGGALPLLFWVAWMVSTCQSDNLQYPFNVSYIVLLALSTASIGLIAASARVGGARSLLGSLAAGICFLLSVCSMEAGILLAPIFLIILVVRRACWQAAMCLPFVAVGIFIFASGLGHSSAPHGTLRLALIPLRIEFICNFLGSCFFAFPCLAPWLGFFGLCVFAFLATDALRNARRAVLPLSETVLLTLAGFVLISVTAAAFTDRIYFGGASSLATRYSSLSLLFLGCLGAWCVRRLPPRPLHRYIKASASIAACAVLWLLNAPEYTRVAEGTALGVGNNSDLLVNNVGVEGPIFIFLGKGVADFGPDVAFLRAHGLNMFAPGAVPPPAALSAVAQAKSAPACIGYVDAIYPVDDHAIMVEGWAAWSRKSLVSWIVAREGATIIGAARPLAPRADISRVLAPDTEARGFKAGFRMNAGAQGDIRHVDLFGISPREPPQVCLLAHNVTVPAIKMAPWRGLSDITEIASLKVDETQGAAATYALFGAAPPWPHIPSWRVQAGQSAHLQFSLDTRALPVGDSLLVPFSGWNIDAGRRVIIRMNDGTQFSAALRWPWDKPDIMAAIVGHSILTAHPGPMKIDISVTPGMEALVGVPLADRVAADWSKLYDQRAN